VRYFGLSVLSLLILAAAGCGDRGQNAGVPEDAPPPESNATVPSPAPKTLAAALVARDDVLVIAHRGDSSFGPENTRPAFEEAVQCGADLVELDYHHSKDGHPVVFHDKTLDRTTDAVARWGGEKIPLASHSLEELQSLDAGAWFHRRFAGTRIPTLEQALDLILARGSIALIERKAGDAATLCDLLARKGVAEDVVVQSFDWDFLAACREALPECVLGALGSKALKAQQLERLVHLRVAVLGWQHKHITAAFVRTAHAAGLQVWAYTVDDVARAKALVKLGVDAIITNRPCTLREALD